MKKVIRLTESDLMRLVKRVIREGVDNIPLPTTYKTEYPHTLTKNGKSVNVSVGDTWTQEGFDAEEFDYMKHSKSNIAFYCDSRDASKGRKIGLESLETYENSQPLVLKLRSQFCKNGSFNYDKFPSTECINGLKKGREGFQGCNKK